MMETIVSFTSTVITLSMLAVIAEFAFPDGPLKKTVSAAVGLTFLSAVTDQILGIIGRMGV